MKKLIYNLFFVILGTMIFSAQCFAVSNSEIKEDVSIDFLDSSYVFVFKSKYVDVDGVKYNIDARDAMMFENSENGRKLLVENIREPFLSAILSVWESVDTTKNSKSKNSSSEIKTNESMAISFLDEKSATIFKTSYINIDNVEHFIKVPVESRFENSLEGRKSLAEEIPKCFVSVVMAVWGDSPTVETPKKLVESEEIEKKKTIFGENFFGAQEVQNKI